MSQVDRFDEHLTELAALYAACCQRRTSLRIGSAALGWGLLGASHVAAEQTIPAIRRQPQQGEQAGAWVAAVFSHNDRRVRQFADANQIPVAAVNLTDLLDRPDIGAVYVSSHPRQRYPLVMAALTAGKHVLCEPPLALTVAEAQTLVATAASRSKVLGVNFTARANGAVRSLRQLILDDQLGDVMGGAVGNSTLLPTHLQSWRLQPQGGGVIFDRTIHSVDLLRFLFSDEIATVYAAAGRATLGQSGASVEEEIVGQARLARHGILVQLHDAYFPGHQPARLTFEGAQQSVTVKHWASLQQPPRLTLHRQRRATELDLPAVEPFWLSIRQFQQAVTTGDAPYGAGEDGVRALQVCQALHQSISEQRLVALPQGRQ